jgi:hypothetical protein
MRLVQRFDCKVDILVLISDRFGFSVQEVSAVIIPDSCEVVVFLVIADAEFVELVDEVGLVSSQGLFIVEPRDALISNKVDKIHFFLQLKHCFIVSLASLVAALGAITIPLTAHANEQGTHGVEPGVGVLFALD